MKKLLKALPWAALIIALIGLVLPVAPVPIVTMGSTERVGQITFITSDMDPVIDFAGLNHRLDLDADNDSSIRASADDTLDIEIGGADEFQLTANTMTLHDASAADYTILFDGIAQDFYIALDDSEDDLLIGYGSAVATDHVIAITEDADMILGEDQALTFSQIPANLAAGDLLDFTATLGTSDGAVDDFIFFDINLTGSGTEAARDVVGIDLALTDGADTDYLPFGIRIGAGWDTYMMLGPAGDGHIWTEIPIADAGGDSYDFTETLNTSNAGTDDYIFMDVNITGSATESTRDADFLNLNFTEGADVDIIGRGLVMDAGFDNWIVLAGDTGAGVVWQPIPAANAGGDSFDFTDTLGTSDGADDDFRYMDINLTGSATEAARDVIGIELTLTDGVDTDYLPMAIKMDPGWDTFLIMGASGNGTIWSEIPVADAGGDSIDFTDTLGVSDGVDDDYIFMDVNITGAGTEAARDVVGLDLDFVDGADTDSLAYAIELQSGWDQYLNIDTNTFTIYPAPAANSTGDTIDFTDTLASTDGTDYYTFLDVNITEGAAATGTDTIMGLDLNFTADDGDSIPTAINIGAGWDVDINATTDLDVAVGGQVIGTLVNWPAGDAGVTTNLLELIDGSPTDTTGTNTHQALVIDIGVGSSTAGTNNVRGIMIDTVVDDDTVVTTAIEVGDEWNYALDTSAPVLASAMHWFDDFIGDTVNATYTEISGADGQAVQAIVEEQFGVYQLTSGNVGDTPANDLEAITLSLEWQANQGSLVMEARLHMDTAVTTSAMCVGLSDDVATVEMPFIIGGGDAITSNASDAVAFCYDTDAATDEWFFLGVDGDTDSTGNAVTGVAPAAGVYQVLRIEIDSGGEKARGYINGTLVGTLTANAVQINVLLAPWVGVDSHEAASHTVDIDYIYAGADRD